MVNKSMFNLDILLSKVNSLSSAIVGRNDDLDLDLFEFLWMPISLFFSLLEVSDSRCASVPVLTHSLESLVSTMSSSSISFLTWCPITPINAQSWCPILVTLQYLAQELYFPDVLISSVKLAKEAFHHPLSSCSPTLPSRKQTLPALTATSPPQLSQNSQNKKAMSSSYERWSRRVSECKINAAFPLHRHTVTQSESSPSQRQLSEQTGKSDWVGAFTYAMFAHRASDK